MFLRLRLVIKTTVKVCLNAFRLYCFYIYARANGKKPYLDRSDLQPYKHDVPAVLTACCKLEAANYYVFFMCVFIMINGSLICAWHFLIPLRL